MSKRGTGDNFFSFIFLQNKNQIKVLSFSNLAETTSNKINFMKSHSFYVEKKSNILEAERKSKKL